MVYLPVDSVWFALLVWCAYCDCGGCRGVCGAADGGRCLWCSGVCFVIVLCLFVVCSCMCCAAWLMTLL